ncbi:MAG TPA: ABC transporter permease [Opitutaceae bacterium]|nr:ABC transporter permease [Opitutaceae bacterium]
MLLDLRHILRTLLRAPGFTTVVVATLALAIGANTAIFSVVDAALLRPLPFPEPDRLVAVWEKANLFGMHYSPVAMANYTDWRAQNSTFQEIGLHENGGMLLTGTGDAEEVSCGLVTASLFRALQTQPAAGRFWSEGEDLPGAAKTVVLSHGLWQRRFAQDPHIVGSTVQLGGTPYTVIGIMPPSFAIPGQTNALWIPLGALYDAEALKNRQRHNFFVAGRLKPGVTLAQANADLQAIATRLQREYPDSNADIGTFATPLGEHVTGKVRPLYLVLSAAVGLLLFTACANLANLMLARFASRRHETAVRLALGAAPRHLIYGSLLEAGVLGLLGGAVGLVVALWGMELLRPIVPPELARLAPLALDWRVLGFAVAATLATILLIGCAPLWQITRTNTFDAIKQSGARTGPGPRVCPAHLARRDTRPPRPPTAHRKPAAGGGRSDPRHPAGAMGRRLDRYVHPAVLKLDARLDAFLDQRPRARRSGGRRARRHAARRRAARHARRARPAGIRPRRIGPRLLRTQRMDFPQPDRRAGRTHLLVAHRLAPATALHPPPAKPRLRI